MARTGNIILIRDVRTGFVLSSESSMRVTQLETYFLTARLPQPVRASTATISQVSEVIVRLTTDSGLTGIGQGHGPFMLTDGPAGLKPVNEVMQKVSGLVIGQDPFDSGRIWQDLLTLTHTPVRGIPAITGQKRPLMTAMSAVDLALWDLKGKAIARPVHALLGGALRDTVPAYVTGFYYRDGERPDDVVREAASYMEQGYRYLKVKVGGLTPEADAARVALIRRTVGANVALMLDANQGWDFATAVRAAKLFEPQDIYWLEDPMPWYDERQSLQRLKAATGIPIAAGEGEYTPYGLRTLIADGLVDYLIMDATWAGGLTTWQKVSGMAELHHIPLAAHHDPQVHVHALAASATGFILESFADASRDPLWFELFDERPQIVGGDMRVPQAPGFGLELREATLQKYGVKIG